VSTLFGPPCSSSPLLRVSVPKTQSGRLCCETQVPVWLPRPPKLLLTPGVFREMELLRAASPVFCRLLREETTEANAVGAPPKRAVHDGLENRNKRVKRAFVASE